MVILLGVFLHFLGGTASGSFYIPFRKVRKWSWESYWLIGGIFSWLIIPPLAAALTAPGFWSDIQSASGSSIAYTYLMGVLWGIGGLTFGLSMRYLGMSLGMAIALGYCSAFGTLVPPVYYQIFGSPNGEKTISQLWHSESGLFTLAGVLVCLAGIAICGWAGMKKEREQSDEQKKEHISEFHFTKGFFVATFSGILSAFMSFGFQTGQPIARAAVAHGTDPLWKNNPVLVVILLGGLSTNLVWCILLNLRNRSLGDYLDRSSPLAKNYLFSALAGTTWYLQFFFYGMGESIMSRTGFGFSSWTLHMSFIIIVSTLWGLFLNEWKGSGRGTMRLITLGIGVVIFSTVLVGWGNYLAAGPP